MTDPLGSVTLPVRVANVVCPNPELVKKTASAAMQSVEALKLPSSVTIVGLAKNEEEIFFPGDMQSIKLPWDSESLKLIRRIRDEVHRFGINFHRNQRSRGTFVNELEQIKGIGKSTADILLKQFKSVKKIKELSEEELTKAVGISKANIILNYFSTSNPINPVIP